MPPGAETIRLAASAGAARARTIGAAAASGTHCAFLDADDRWHREKIARQLEAARGRDGDRFVIAARCAIAHGGREFVHPRGVKETHAPVADQIYRFASRRDRKRRIDTPRERSSCATRR